VEKYFTCPIIRNSFLRYTDTDICIEHLMIRKMCWILIYYHDCSDYKRDLNWQSDLLYTYGTRYYTLQTTISHTRSSQSATVFTSRCFVAAKISSETSVDFHRTTRHYIPEDRTHHSHGYGKFKFNINRDLFSFVNSDLSLTELKHFRSCPFTCYCRK
jgi:hypothetical protein